MFIFEKLSRTFRNSYIIAATVVSVCTLIGTGIFLLSSEVHASPQKPNILLLMVDDLNDYVGAFDGYIGAAGSGHIQASTPNIDRFLRDSGTTNFLSAQTPVPACKGVRTAIMTGLSPVTTGVVSNSSKSLSLDHSYDDFEFMHDYFKSNGYYTMRIGKVEHGTERRDFEISNQLRAEGKSIVEAFDGSFTSWDKVISGLGLNNEYKSAAEAAGYDITLDQSLGKLAEFRWGSLDLDESLWSDYKTTSAAIEFIQDQGNSPNSQPFYLAHGIVKPHLPWFCPEKYFDQIAADSTDVILPTTLPGDLTDVGPTGQVWASDPNDPNDVSTYMNLGGDEFKKEAVHAYLACSSFADAQVGRLLDALEQSGLADETIVVLVSDHGFMLGEKNSWGKLKLWEEALRVPFGIKVPDQYLGGNKARPQYIFPVSTGSIFPTLADVALNDDISSDYKSLEPLINSATTDSWKAENIASYYGSIKNVSLRRPVYRFIKYLDGFEELYDHRYDQGEHNNVADEPVYETKRNQSCTIMNFFRKDTNC